MVLTINNDINRLVSVAETQLLSCEVRTGFIRIMQKKFTFAAEGQITEYVLLTLKFRQTELSAVGMLR
jgi:hypothetical protein